MSSPDSVGLWYARTSAIRERRVHDLVWELLTAAERKKYDAFRFQKNKDEYLLTRGVERAVLARCLGKRPSELAFSRTEYGRPVLEPATTLRFNLTNTVEMVACAVTDGREIGVDAEPLARADDVIEVASTVFTAEERAMLADLPLDARRRRAVELWTLKEAYMKARGLGMSLPVQEFAVTFDGTPALDLAPSIDDDAARWSLTICEIADHLGGTRPPYPPHLVSVCVERRPEDDAPVAIARPIAIEQADLLAMLSAP